MRRSLLLVFLVAIIIFILPQGVIGQDEDEAPVVRAVLFFSQSCPHCHTVINEFLVPMIEKEGDKLAIIGVDIAQPGGQELYLASTQRFSVPDERQGVPRLVVGDRVLVGSVEIPQEFPKIYAEGLANDGIDWPDIPGLTEVIALSAEQEAQHEGPEQPPSREAQATDTPVPEAEANSTSVPEGEPTPAEHVLQLGEEPLPPEPTTDTATEGGTLAAIILGAMLLALIYTIARAIVARDTLFASNGELIGRAWSWLIPLLALIGLGVAGYLAYVEITHTAAVCGPVGKCNIVQSSEYASIAGIPVAVLGMLNYIAVLVLWTVHRFASGKWSWWAALALLLLTIFGVLFSIYLTLMELFVIHAICAWCLASAIITTVLMLLVLLQLTGRGTVKSVPPRQSPTQA
ncbi:MAG: vitamin K epoxide reductase family protein [Chloroflexota bacterium]|nr:vitamin K epoxide reductase family protein [Chloroflexota bacterium]